MTTLRVTTHAVEQQWVVLTCSGHTTVRLADSLKDAGLEAWTPVEEQRRQIRGKFEWVRTPMLPRLVFASAVHAEELRQLARQPSLSYLVWNSEKQRMVAKGHPFFRLFRVGDDYPLISDRALEPLRAIEGRRKGKTISTHTFTKGDRIKLTDRAYEGLRGVVVEVRGKTATVRFTGSRLDFDIPTRALLPDLDDVPQVHVYVRQYEQARVAKAA